MKYNKFYINDKLDVCFGYNCKHSEWFQNLNSATQDRVVEKISYIRNSND